MFHVITNRVIVSECQELEVLCPGTDLSLRDSRIVDRLQVFEESHPEALRSEVLPLM